MTAPGGRPIVHTHKRRGMLSPPPDKPCPTCYAVMKVVDGWWHCPNHGPISRAQK